MGSDFLVGLNVIVSIFIDVAKMIVPREKITVRRERYSG